MKVKQSRSLLSVPARDLSVEQIYLLAINKCKGSVQVNYKKHHIWVVYYNRTRGWHGLSHIFHRGLCRAVVFKQVND